MYPGQVHRMKQAKRAAEFQPQPQQLQQPLDVMQQQQQQPSSYAMHPQQYQQLIQQPQPMSVAPVFAQQSSMPTKQSLLFSVKAKKLKAADWNGKSDPYLEFYRLERNGWTKVHTTPVQYKTLKPVWTGLSIPMDALCYGDRNRPVLLRCFDYDEGQSPDHLGDCQVTVQELLESKKSKFELKGTASSIFSCSLGHLSFFNVSISNSSPTNTSASMASPQFQQRPQTGNGFPGVIYSATGAAHASVQHYGQPLNSQPIAYGQPAIQQQGYVLASSGYVANQATNLGHIANQPAPATSVYGYNPIPKGNQSVYNPPKPVSQYSYSSFIQSPSASYARPNGDSTSSDDLPPPSYDELYRKSL